MDFPKKGKLINFGGKCHSLAVNTVPALPSPSRGLWLGKAGRLALAPVHGCSPRDTGQESLALRLDVTVAALCLACLKGTCLSSLSDKPSLTKQSSRHWVSIFNMKFERTPVKGIPGEIFPRRPLGQTEPGEALSRQDGS